MTEFGQFMAKVAAEFGRLRPTFVRFRSNIAQLRPTLGDSVRIVLGLGHISTRRLSSAKRPQIVVQRPQTSVQKLELCWPSRSRIQPYTCDWPICGPMLAESNRAQCSKDPCSFPRASGAAVGRQRGGKVPRVRDLNDRLGRTSSRKVETALLTRPLSRASGLRTLEPLRCVAELAFRNERHATSRNDSSYHWLCSSYHDRTSGGRPFGVRLRVAFHFSPNSGRRQPIW